MQCCVLYSVFHADGRLLLSVNDVDCYIIIIIIIIIIIRSLPGCIFCTSGVVGALGSIVVEALCYKLEGRSFQTR
jgi:hypothetical protein